MSQQFWILSLSGILMIGLCIFGLLSKESDDNVPAFDAERHWLANFLEDPATFIFRAIFGPTLSHKLENVGALLLCIFGVIFGLAVLGCAFWLEFT